MSSKLSTISLVILSLIGCCVALINAASTPIAIDNNHALQYPARRQINEADLSKKAFYENAPKDAKVKRNTDYMSLYSQEMDGGPQGFQGMRESTNAVDPNYEELSDPSAYFLLPNDNSNRIKRAPSNFLGMRGKKAPSGFLGLRGKKVSNFLGLRGKKFDNEKEIENLIQSLLNNEHRALSDYQHIRGDNFYQNNLLEEDDENLINPMKEGERPVLYPFQRQASIKRAPSTFMGLRG